MNTFCPVCGCFECICSEFEDDTVTEEEVLDEDEDEGVPPVNPIRQQILGEVLDTDGRSTHQKE